MKGKIFIPILLSSMMLMVSCIKKTTVINTVYEDGSVTRKVTMKSDEKDISPDSYRVPIDSTWQIENSFEIGSKQDTTWILTAVKHFESVDEINEEYSKDSGTNKDMKRSAHFTKCFKWFTTVYRCSEKIERFVAVDNPQSDFFSEEDLKYLSMPKSVKEELENGPDSLQIRVLNDTLETKFEQYLLSSLVKKWILVFFDQIDQNPDADIEKTYLSSREREFINEINIEASEDNFEIDSFIVEKLGLEFYTKYKSEIDSSNVMVEDIFETFFSSSEYDLGIIMPGKMIATNGYAKSISESDIGGAVLWNVDLVHFLTEDYVMWSESRINNYWTWILTALFIVFVIIGFVKRFK
jgi:hypothetical protein